MLTFAEELYLLALDETLGKLQLPDAATHFDSTLIGAVFVELSFDNRIDATEDKITLVDSAPTGKEIEDYILAELAKKDSKEFTFSYILSEFEDMAKKINDSVLNNLLKKGILELHEDRVMWILKSRSYPVINNEEIQEVEARLRDIICRNETPSPRDAALVGLMEVNDLHTEILSPRELRRFEARIEEVIKYDQVARNFNQSIKEMILVLSESMIACSHY